MNVAFVSYVLDVAKTPYVPRTRTNCSSSRRGPRIKKELTEEERKKFRAAYMRRLRAK